MEMFDEIAQVTVSPDGTVEAKLVDDASQEMENAVAEMARAWQNFKNAEGPAAYHGYGWWKALMWLSCAENRLKEAFCGRDRSPRSVALYHRWRMRIVGAGVGGRGLRADA
jgi:hypothetical protein